MLRQTARVFEPVSNHWRRLHAEAESCAGSNSGAGANCALRVLLAEDTPICAEMMQEMARHLEIRLDTAVNGLEAIAMVQEAAERGEPYSLLLLDVMMPVLDGIETARRLRAEGIGAQDLPIIAVTAAAQLDEVRAYRAAGMQAFLEKPVALDDLRATLKAWGHATASPRPPMHSGATAALHEKFEQRKTHTLARVEAALGRSDIGEQEMLELRNMVHQLAGSAGSFGDASLGDAMRTIEGELVARFLRGDRLDPVLRSARATLRERLA